MSETKAVRLAKVAKECNVSIPTIVDFLAKKGIQIESNPNTKLDGDIYDMLLANYQADVKVKEKAMAVTIGREVRETIAIGTMADKDAEKAAEKASKPAEVKAPETKAPETKAPEVKAPETEPTEVQPSSAQPIEATPEPKVETPHPQAEREEPKAEVAAPVAPPAVDVSETPAPKAEAPEAESKNTEGVKVIGKIDLAALNQKTRPTKGKKEAAPVAEEKKPEPVAPKPEPQPVAEVKAPEPVAPPAPEAPAPPKEAELYRAKTEKLSGLTVLGKIELPVDKKSEKKPVASSSDADKKRKRKRIDGKVDVSKEAERNKNKPPQQRPNTPGQRNDRFGKPGNRNPEVKPEVTEEQIRKEIKETLARLSGAGKSKSAKNRRDKRDRVAERLELEREEMEREKSVLKVTEFVTVAEIASMMDASPTQIISACMSLGIFASINQRLDAETLSIIAEEFGYQIQFVGAEDQEAIIEEEDTEDDLLPRAPIVTVMGHVDHGKTSLLDYIRKANVIAGEAGGITQHIGAYRVELNNGKTITFLDTPGHEAFTAMRARGAQVTDLAIIVIAADDSVMPQTREAINHAQAANVPMIFAFNKMDKPGANADKIREELAQMNILVEEWGGKYQTQEISAKKGDNIELLLEKVLLEAELMDLKANPAKRAIGTIIESSLDKGRGYVATLLVEAGSLRVGDIILAGQFYGRIKAMFNERGLPVKVAGPSDPVSVLGINGAVAAGDKFHVLADEREAREIATKRQQLQREQGLRTQKHITLDEIGRRLAIGNFRELNIIIKGDVDGSVEALTDSLLKLSTDAIQVNIIHKAVGPITESDVLLASASDAIIIGFQVRPVASAKKLAEKEQIEIRHYSIIYDAIAEVKDAMEGMLAPDIVEQIIGTIEIREVFNISKVGTIAGCFVQDGKVNRNSKIRLIRDGIVIHTGNLGSLKRFKDDVKEVTKGYECGLNLANFNDIKIGDIVEAYEETEVKKKL
ncbi:MAG TPA: translation initiation factor IF-2 [Luteibaculaceae bacterium]|nr:translation initiation factor IF-2 [Luteibaculaceae bacterium]